MKFDRGEMVEWLIDDHQRLVLTRSDEAVADLKKTSEQKASLTAELDKILAKETGAFMHPKIAQRVRPLAYGNSTCLGCHRIDPLGCGYR